MAIERICSNKMVASTGTTSTRTTCTSYKIIFIQFNLILGWLLYICMEMNMFHSQILCIMMSNFHENWHALNISRMVDYDWYGWNAAHINCRWWTLKVALYQFFLVNYGRSPILDNDPCNEPNTCANKFCTYKR